MISKLEKAPVFDKVTYSSIRIESLINIYGLEQDFISFYQMDFGSVFVIFDDVLTLYANESCNYEELAVFVYMHHNVKIVFSDKQSVKKMNTLLNGKQTNVILLKKSKSFDMDDAADDIEPKEAYPLLKEVFNEGVLPFDIWYADAFYRFRNNQMHIKGIHDQNMLVTCALTVAETNHSWIVGGVATLPSYRHKGYARRCIAALSSMMNKDIYISPKNEYAQNMYLKMGFALYEECASLELT